MDQHRMHNYSILVGWRRTSTVERSTLPNQSLYPMMTKTYHISLWGMMPLLWGRRWWSHSQNVIFHVKNASSTTGCKVEESSRKCLWDTGQSLPVHSLYHAPKAWDSENHHTGMLLYSQPDEDVLSSYPERCHGPDWQQRQHQSRWMEKWYCHAGHGSPTKRKCRNKSSSAAEKLPQNVLQQSSRRSSLAI